MAALGWGVGCAADFESDPVLMCTEDRGCPTGSRCNEDRLCEVIGAQTPGPGVPSPIAFLDFPSPSFDGEFIPQLDGGFFVDTGIEPFDAQGICAPGTTACGVDCVDLNTNRDHCGTCDFRCSLGEDCTLGACLEGLPGILPNPGI